MDKRIIIGILLVSLLLAPLCTEHKETPAEKTAVIPAEPTEESIPEKQEPATTLAASPLSELQTDACNNADLGGTCKSKLEELNIVPLGDCCKYLGKCCQ